MTLPLEKQEALVRRAMELAAQTAKIGNLPFAGILADETGTIVLEATNTVNSTHNAAAHAEINLLYAAADKLRTNNLSSYIFISNAASCPMCATALIKARITRFYYGAPNEGTMVPNITMDEVISKVPFAIEVYGSILADECAAQVRELAIR
jgi:tRNA(adenine34) deaminase